MKYEIIGQTVPVVEITLNRGETMYTQSGGMAYQTEGINMNTNARGGLMKSFGRAFSGESIFMVNYTAEKDGAMIAFATTIPGSIIPVDLTGSNIPPNTRIFVNFQFAQWGDHYRPMKYGNVENNGNNISTNLLAISLGSDVLVYQKDGTCIVKHILSPSTTEKNVNLK